MMKQVWENLADKKYGGARGVADPTVHDYVKLLVRKVEMDNIIEIRDDYLDAFTNWINKSQLNSIHIDTSWKPVYSNGTTETFDKFYMKHRNKRFRTLPGEYFYHKITFKRLNYQWKELLEADDVKPGDAVIISMPFSDTGSEHYDMMDILDRCYDIGVPVLLDCCYFGLCGGLDFPVNHPAITTLTFSLSKCFDVPSLRAGIRYTREDDDDPMFVYHKNNYINHFGATIGFGLLELFPSDFIPAKYHGQQLQICERLGIVPSNCVNLATTIRTEYEYLRRGNSWSRLNVAQDFCIDTPGVIH